MSGRSIIDVFEDSKYLREFSIDFLRFVMRNKEYQETREFGAMYDNAEELFTKYLQYKQEKRNKEHEQLMQKQKKS